MSDLQHLFTTDRMPREHTTASTSHFSYDGHLSLHDLTKAGKRKMVSSLPVLFITRPVHRIHGHIEKWGNKNDRLRRRDCHACNKAN